MFPQDKEYLRVSRAPELAGRDRRLWRIFEILPGTLAWTTFAGMIIIARFLPTFAALFILLFDLYWFLRTVYLSFHLRSSYRKMKESLRIDWVFKVNQLHPAEYRVPVQKWQDLWHLVIFPVYLESYDILRTSFEALKTTHYPHERLLVVLATEERAGAASEDAARRISEEYSGAFGGFLVTRHPANIPGELAGKGANEAWAGREAVEKLVQPHDIPYSHVVVSVLDSDTVVYPEFFGCLAYHYLTAEKPLRSSFQPIPLFINNVWTAPAFARVMGFSSSFWQMMQQARPERLITFSSHSMGLEPLVEIGFWQTNVVSEDSRIFYQCFLFYDGDWQVVPLHYPVAMDANFAGSVWGTVKNQYKQQRRWGYGAENIPYLFFAFSKNNKIPYSKKLLHGFNILEGFHSWSTNSIMMFVLGWLPLVIGGRRFTSTLLSYNLPQITGWIMTFAMVGMITSAVLSISLLPLRPSSYGRWKYILIFLQWFLMPFTMILLSSIPAIEAQTRLMFGRYMGFWFTPKVRRPETTVVSPVPAAER